MKVKTKSGMTLKVDTKLINPQIAKLLLRGCRKNRSPAKSRIKRYAQGMKLGEWVVAQPLLLDEEGKLLDGQHRMHAVMESGVPVEFLVIEGYDRDTTFGKIDDVRSRSLKDWFHVLNVNLPGVASGVVMWAARDIAGRIPCGSGGKFHLTPIEGVEFLEVHPEISLSVKGPGTSNIYVPKVMSAFCHWKFCKSDQALADTFFMDLSIGENEGDGDPVFLLRERMRSDRRAKMKLGKTEKLALVYKSWNAVRLGESLFNLRWRSTGPNPEPFPEVL